MIKIKIQPPLVNVREFTFTIPHARDAVGSQSSSVAIARCCCAFVFIAS